MHSGLGLRKGQDCLCVQGLTVQMGKLRPGERLGLVQSHLVKSVARWAQSPGPGCSAVSRFPAVVYNSGKQNVLSWHLSGEPSSNSQVNFPANLCIRWCY